MLIALRQTLQMHNAATQIESLCRGHRLRPHPHPHPHPHDQAGLTHTLMITLMITLTLTLTLSLSPKITLTLEGMRFSRLRDLIVRISLAVGFDKSNSGRV